VAPSDWRLIGSRGLWSLKAAFLFFTLQPQRNIPLCKLHWFEALTSWRPFLLLLMKVKGRLGGSIREAAKPPLIFCRRPTCEALDLHQEKQTIGRRG